MRVSLTTGALILVALILWQKGGDLMTNVVSQTDAFYSYDYAFKKYGRYYRVPWRWLKAIAMNESSLGQNPLVKAGLVSTDGLSYGLMQVTVRTATAILGRDATAADLNDSDTSVRLAAELLSQLSTRFKGDQENMIRAYNGGPAWASKSQAVVDRTQVYYDRFKRNLARVLEKQPGDDREFY